MTRVVEFSCLWRFPYLRWFLGRRRRRPGFAIDGHVHNLSRAVGPGFKSFSDFSPRLDATSRIFFHHVADEIDELIANIFVKTSRMPGRFLQMPSRLAFWSATRIGNFARNGIIQCATE